MIYSSKSIPRFFFVSVLVPLGGFGGEFMVVFVCVCVCVFFFFLVGYASGALWRGERCYVVFLVVFYTDLLSGPLIRFGCCVL